MNQLENFLDETEIEELTKLVINDKFPWYYLKECTEQRFKVPGLISGPVFRHSLYMNNRESSIYFDLFRPFILKICENFSSDICINNLYCNFLVPDMSKIGEHTYAHVDFDYGDEDSKQFNTYTGIFYLNDCDGDTIFFKEKDGEYVEDERISPKRNMFVYWDSDQVHAAPYCGSKERYVVNINFLVPK